MCWARCGPGLSDQCGGFYSNENSFFPSLIRTGFAGVIQSSSSSFMLRQLYFPLTFQSRIRGASVGCRAAGSAWADTLGPAQTYFVLPWRPGPDPVPVQTRSELYDNQQGNFVLWIVSVFWVFFLHLNAVTWFWTQICGGKWTILLSFFASLLMKIVWF